MTNVLDAIVFALEEAARFQHELSECGLDCLKQNPMDALWTLPHKNGKGDMVCGQAAGQALFDALCDKISEGSYAGRVDLKKIYGRYTAELVDSFVSKRRELTTQNEELVFARALRPSIENLKDRVHLVPCNLVMAKNPDHLGMGPVTFRRREAHWGRVENLLQEHYAQREIKASIAIDEIKAFYGSFNWYAEIDVENCEEGPAREIAFRMAWSAIDCCQLLIGGEGLERMSVGDVAIGENKEAHIVISYGKIDNLSVTLKGQDIPLGEDVWRQTSSDHVRDTLHLMGLAIKNTHNLSKPPELSNRFIDAVHWYGLAMRDPNPSTRLVALVMAVERLLLPKKVYPIESTVRFRSAPLVRWKRHRKRLKKIYETRNLLAHGKLSSRAPELYTACRDANIFANSVLFECLHLFGENGLTKSGVSVDEIENAFEKWGRVFVEEQKRKCQP